MADKIQVDTREPDKIFNLCDKHGMNYEKTALPVGDFVKGNVVIERKTIPDFISSIRKGHLQKQLLQMEENYEKVFLVISGKFSDILAHPYLRGWTVNHHMGSLASVAVRYPKTKIIQVDNDTQLVNIVGRIIEKASDGKKVELKHTELMRSKVTTEDIELKMLTCIPKLGIEKALIATKHLAVQVVSRDSGDPIMETKDLLHIHGIGDTIAEHIINLNMGE